MLIKICGMIEQHIVDRAVALGADMCGFIFHPSSPRHVTAAQAVALDTRGMARVGVFVEQSEEEAARIAQEARLDFIQLHGGQSAVFTAGFATERIIRVLWPKRYASLAALQADIDALAPACGLYLLDAGMGSGMTLDWPSLAGLRFPHPWMLSGGLGPDNVRQALASCSPDGLDLNSRLESSPGRKSLERMEALFAALGKGSASVEDAL
ncbi:phosphoribosylanthranilate isomerase [Mailhella sp.]|uniref:phosphoribosylanthranilate isomerase n=1 Tax=Mailhella sp. TaxID=1981029 RepID=UPI00406412B9